MAGTNVRRIAMAAGAAGAMAAGSIWPGMTAETARQFTRIGRGLPIDKPNQFAQIHVRYYHVVAYPAAGGTQLNFFNVGSAEHICNFGNGSAPDERPFWLTGLTVSLQAQSVAGVASTATRFSADTVASVAANQVANILEGGLLQLSVGDRLIHEGQGLEKYPADGGIFVSGSSGALAANNVCAWNNGQPLSGNRFKFPAPYPILPNKQIKLALKWQAALALTGAALARIRVELVGESILPLNA